MKMNMRGIALLIMIGVWLLVGQLVIYNSVYEIPNEITPEIIIDCQPIIQEVAGQPIEEEIKIKSNKKDDNECPEDIIPDTITLRNNYDIFYKSKWGDREQIHMPDGSNNARCYAGIRYWQEPDYLYCENTLYDGDEGRYLVTFVLDTDRNYDKDDNLIEYEVVEMGCLRRG